MKSLKTIETIEDVEAYLGSQACKSTETPLTIWNARKLILLEKRLAELLEGSKKLGPVSDIGRGIVDMATENKRDFVRQQIIRLESYVMRIENNKYIFDTKNYKPGTFYQIFTEIVIHLKTIQMAFYEYMAVHSNLEATPESMKNGVNYIKRMKGGNRND